MKFGNTEQPTQENKPVEKKPTVVNRIQLGKATNQAISVIVSKGLNIEDEDVQRRYKKLAKLFYQMDDEIAEEITRGA